MTGSPDLGPLLAEVALAARGARPLRVAASLVEVVARAGGWSVPADLRVAGVRPLPAVLALEVAPELARPELLGVLYEAALHPEARSAGAHYTPADLASRLVALVAGPDVALRPTPMVWDPACGGGVFLLAAADALFARGVAPDVVVADLLWGTDVDPGAVAVAEAALSWWAGRRGASATPGPHLAVADPLVDVVSARPRSDRARQAAAGPLPVAAAAGFDLVVGNPPFQSQLAGDSIRSAGSTAVLRARWGDAVVRPYTDTAGLFLVAGARALAPGGRLAMILPTSVLAARDAAPARAAVAAVGELTDLWVAAEPVFGAAVQVCAVVVERNLGRPTVAGPLASGSPPVDVESSGDARALLAPGPSAPTVVRRWRGRTVVPLPPARAGSVVRSAAVDGDGWAALALAALGVPDPPARSSGRLADLGTARAGFREEYYGLVGHVTEAPEGTHPAALPTRLAPLVTSGLVDPGRCAWGERSASFARQRYERPVVDLASLEAAGGRAATWTRSLLVPKVVVATQTRVGEAAVDREGRWVASTPTIAVVAPADRLWALAAVVCSPIGSVAALAATAGTARAAQAIRHTVASIGSLPLPVDVEAWDAGAEALRRHDREAFLAAMAAAYDVSADATSELHDWWTARAPWPA
ncbi:hypothetical protein BH10ACT1_BH10ACT1_37450 [soil metagenome]